MPDRIQGLGHRGSGEGDLVGSLGADLGVEGLEGPGNDLVADPEVGLAVHAEKAHLDHRIHQTVVVEGQS